MGPLALYFFPRAILYIFFLFLLIYGDLGLGSYFGLLGLGFSVDSVWEKYIYICICNVYYIYISTLMILNSHNSYSV